MPRQHPVHFALFALAGCHRAPPASAPDVRSIAVTPEPDSLDASALDASAPDVAPSAPLDAGPVAHWSPVHRIGARGETLTVHDSGVGTRDAGQGGDGGGSASAHADDDNTYADIVGVPGGAVAVYTTPGRPGADEIVARRFTAAGEASGRLGLIAVLPEGTDYVRADASGGVVWVGLHRDGPTWSEVRAVAFRDDLSVHGDLVALHRHSTRGDDLFLPFEVQVLAEPGGGARFAYATGLADPRVRAEYPAPDPRSEAAGIDTTTLRWVQLSTVDAAHIALAATPFCTSNVDSPDAPQFLRGRLVRAGGRAWLAGSGNCETMVTSATVSLSGVNAAADFSVHAAGRELLSLRHTNRAPMLEAFERRDYPDSGEWFYYPEGSVSPVRSVSFTCPAGRLHVTVVTAASTRELDPADPDTALDLAPLFALDPTSHGFRGRLAWTGSVLLGVDPDAGPWELPRRWACEGGHFVETMPAGDESQPGGS